MVIKRFSKWRPSAILNLRKLPYWSYELYLHVILHLPSEFRINRPIWHRDIAKNDFQYGVRQPPWIWQKKWIFLSNVHPRNMAKEQDRDSARYCINGKLNLIRFSPRCSTIFYFGWKTGKMDFKVCIYSLQCALSCDIVYCNRPCLWRAGGRCESVTTTLQIACIDPHQTGFVGKGSDHLQLITFWPSRAGDIRLVSIQ